MKKIILMLITLVMIVTGCAKESNITFEATIDSLSESSMLVTTDNHVGFDKASVALSKAKIEGDLMAGRKVKITSYPEVRETYPVQITAIKVEVISGSYQKITAEEAKKRMDQGDYDVILDVRTLEEYNEGHIEGAQVLPDYEIKEKAEATLNDKEEVILVYCRSGKRSKTAVEELIDLGYTNVYDFGGMIDWPYEIVKE